MARIKDRWPIIETEEVDRLAAFYVDTLGFTLAERAADAALVDMSGVHILIRKGGRGFAKAQAKAPCGIPLHNKRNPELKDATAVRPWSFTAPGREPVLYIPKFSPAKYREEIILRGVAPLTGILSETPYQDHSFEGFYLRDVDGNALCFYRDFHGPCLADAWDIFWEPALTEERAKECDERERRAQRSAAAMRWCVVPHTLFFLASFYAFIIYTSLYPWAPWREESGLQYLGIFFIADPALFLAGGLLLWSGRKHRMPVFRRWFPLIAAGIISIPLLADRATLSSSCRMVGSVASLALCMAAALLTVRAAKDAIKGQGCTRDGGCHETMV